MELLQLKYFCDAAETENFSKTAKRFMVPVSNISQSVKRLEKELKKQLFTRSSNKIKLNESGLSFYKNIKTALDLIDSGTKTVQNSYVPETIKINISVNRQIVMKVIEKFQKLYPTIKFIVSHSILQNINDFDIIVTDKELDTVYIRQEATQEKLLLAYNKDFFNLPQKINGTELEKYSFITMQMDTSLYNCTRNVCNALGFEPNIVLQSDDPFYVRKCIELGLGIAIVPSLSWNEQFSNCVKLQNIGNYKRKIYVYQKRSVNEHLQKFNDLLIENFKNYRF